MKTTHPPTPPPSLHGKDHLIADVPQRVLAELDLLDSLRMRMVSRWIILTRPAQCTTAPSPAITLSSDRDCTCVSCSSVNTSQEDRVDMSFPGRIRTDGLEYGTDVSSCALFSPIVGGDESSMRGFLFCRKLMHHPPKIEHRQANNSNMEKVTCIRSLYFRAYFDASPNQPTACTSVADVCPHI